MPKVRPSVGTSGIYRIVQIGTDREYVGSSKNITARWRCHIIDLNNPNRRYRHSRFFQNCWDKYGPDAFLFEIIEECSLDQLIIREQHYLDTRHPVFNGRPTANSPLGTKQSTETIAKRSKALTGLAPSAMRLAYYARRRGMKAGPHPPERRAKISQAKSGVMWSEARRKAQEGRGFVPQTEQQRASTKRLVASKAKAHTERNERIYAVLVARGWDKVIPMRRKNASLALVADTGYDDCTVYRALKEFEEQGILKCTLTPRPPLTLERRRAISEQMKLIRAKQEAARKGDTTSRHPAPPPFTPPSSLHQLPLFQEDAS